MNKYKLITLIIITILSIYFLYKNKRENFIVTNSVEETFIEINDEIEASAGIIYDIQDDKIIAGKNTKIPKSIASVTKLTSGLISFSYLNEEDVTTISSSDFNLIANTPLRLNETWNTLDLLKFSLITSSNRGINAISRTIEEKTGKSLVDLMNTFVRDNNLVQTHFINETGLDAHNNLAGSESSAYDLAKIVSIIVNVQKELALVTTNKREVYYSLDGVKYIANNTNRLLGRLEDRVLLSKTGYTHIAGGALIMVLEIKDKMIAFVVLESSKNGRFSDMQKLIEIYKMIDV